MKKQSKKVSNKLKKTRVTKKKQIGRGGNNKSNNTKDDLFNKLLELNKIPVKESNYFKQVLADAIMLYPYVDKVGDTYTSCDYNGIFKDETPPEKKKKPQKKNMASFLRGEHDEIDEDTYDKHINTELKFTFDGDNTQYTCSDGKKFKLAIPANCYKEDFKGYKLFDIIKIYSKKLIFKCMIFKELAKEDANHILLFKWGSKVDLYDETYHNVIKNLNDIIDDKINGNGRLILFGFSMGGNIAQHIVLKSIKELRDQEEPITSNALRTFDPYHFTLISLGIGGTLKEEDKQLLDEWIGGSYMSIGLLTDSDDKTSGLNPYTQINKYVVPDFRLTYNNKEEKDKLFTSLNTVLIHGNLLATGSDKQLCHKLYGIYKYDELNYKLDNGSEGKLEPEKLVHNELHEFSYYRMFLNMLLNNKHEQPLSMDDNTRKLLL